MKTVLAPPFVNLHRKKKKKISHCYEFYHLNFNLLDTQDRIFFSWNSAFQQSFKYLGHCTQRYPMFAINLYTCAWHDIYHMPCDARQKETSCFCVWTNAILSFRTMMCQIHQRHHHQVAAVSFFLWSSHHRNIDRCVLYMGRSFVHKCLWLFHG